MPFGLTIYVDRVVDIRLSACCEHKYQCGKLLGSRKTANFGLVKLSGGKPCFRCEMRKRIAVKDSVAQEDSELIDAERERRLTSVASEVCQLLESTSC